VYHVVISSKINLSVKSGNVKLIEVLN